MNHIPPFQPPAEAEQRDVAMALLKWYHDALIVVDRKLTANMQYQQAIYAMLVNAGFRTDGAPARAGTPRPQRSPGLGDIANIAGFVMQNPGTIEGLRKVVSMFMGK